MSGTLFEINNALTALAGDLHVRWQSEQDEDDALNTATYAVAEAFGLRHQKPRSIEQIVERKLQGIDCDQDESAIVKAVMRVPGVYGGPENLAELFPAEWDEVEAEGTMGDLDPFAPKAIHVPDDPDGIVLQETEGDAEDVAFYEAAVLVETFSDGYRVFGPFEDFDTAAGWADTIQDPTWIVTLHQAPGIYAAGGGA